jgi:hemoglobin
MKKDIKNRADIELLVDNFYGKVKSDKLIGHFFTEVFQINWEKHLPLMTDFIDNIIFFSGNYSGNPMNLHLHLNEINAIQKKHFTRWKKLFFKTLDELYIGEKATLIKQKIESISNIMQKNIFQKT